VIAIFCGDRNWSDADLIRDVLMRCPPGTIIIEGEARGADTLARIEAEKCGFTVLRFPADWKAYGRAAGPVRNTAMLKALLDSPDPDKWVIAFHNDIASSKGTKNMVEQARRKGVRTDVKQSDCCE
jgi:hypothetical protein